MHCLFEVRVQLDGLAQVGDGVGPLPRVDELDCPVVVEAGDVVDLGDGGIVVPDGIGVVLELVVHSGSLEQDLHIIGFALV